jgi:hypothetical protein
VSIRPKDIRFLTRLENTLKKFKARRGERLGLPDELLIGSIDLEWDW